MRVSIIDLFTGVLLFIKNQQSYISLLPLMFMHINHF